MKCQLSNISINYEIFGEGRPMVLLHGIWTDHWQMIGCMEPNFENHGGWKRIYPDLPGMGKTPGEAWITNSDNMLDIVCEFINTVIPEEPFVVGGYSYGAYLARGVLHRKFEQVDGLLLVCPVIVANPAERTLPPKAVIVKNPELMSKLTPEEQERYEAWIVVQSQRVIERTQDEIDVGGALADEAFLARLQTEGYTFSFAVDALNQPFEKPALILAGRQDWIVGYRDAWEIIEHYPRATFEVVDRAGHNLPIEQEDVFNTLVSEWLDRVEENLKRL